MLVYTEMVQNPTEKNGRYLMLVQENTQSNE